MLLAPLLLAAAAQIPTPVPLPPPSALLPEEFSVIISVRELADGRLLVADDRETRLVVADFRTGRVESLGRVGDGPGEYRRVAPLRPLGGDSTLMISIYDRRWFVLDGERMATILPPDHPMVVAGSAEPIMRTTAMMSLPPQTDSRGSMLAFTGPPMAMQTRTASPRDSLAVVLISRATGRVDTIAQVLQRPTGMTAIAGGMGARFYYPPWAVGEQTVLMVDGWVAVVRLDPYRIDWRAPDGRWTRGAALPVPAMPVTPREREAWLAQLAAQEPKPADGEWPRTIPPIGHDNRFTAQGDLAGQVIVHRSTGVDDRLRRYDVIDRAGRIVRQVTMPRDHRLVGFGRGTAYVVVTDDDGLQRIQRHPWS